MWGFYGLRDTSPIRDNQMEKNVENKMQDGVHCLGLGF